jgi:Excisionase-like protein
MKRIPLDQWARAQYDPPPSAWVLRKWAREGEIWPSPERVGRSYYVREDARRQTEARPSLVERLTGAA